MEEHITDGVVFKLTFAVMLLCALYTFSTLKKFNGISWALVKHCTCAKITNTGWHEERNGEIDNGTKILITLPE